jgi:flagellar hook-associated protein 1 FlgK
MSNYAVGLTGLEVARKAIQVIGNNIANAATEGYHRQAPVITPLAGGITSATQIGRGAEVSDVRRMIDLLLEREIRRQRPQLGQVGQELTALESLESMLGDLTTGGLAGALNDFFGSLDELASQPESAAFQEQAVWAADSLASQFRTLGTTIGRLKDNALHEARNLADEVNRLAREIADANVVAASVWKRGGADDNLMDIRDQAVAELAELADVEVQAQQDGSYTVYAWGMPIVVQSRVTEIEVDYADTDTIGVSAAGAHHYNSGLRGGRVGGMLALYNDLLPRVEQDLDTLACEIIQSINQAHVQGVGTAGSFAELIGWPVESSPVGEWTAPVTAGDIHLRIVNTATGEITRRTVTITDPATETVSDIAILLDAVPNLSSNVAGSRLRIVADAGFTFDFLPALVPTPASSTLTGTAEPTLSGVFTGDANETYTCTVVGTGEVGVTAGLAVEVRNGAGELVCTLNVGSGYAAADPLEAAPGSGITLAMSMGTLLAGEQFTIDALADADPTGFLGAAGINTLFSGDSARTMDVVDRVRETPSLLATTLGTDGTDNLNVLHMADVADAPIAALGDSAPSDAYRGIVSTVGQWVAVRRARHDGLDSILSELAGQRDDLSGVDINEEAARLLLFEQMFQAMARYLAAVDEAYQYLMEII